MKNEQFLSIGYSQLKLQEEKSIWNMNQNEQFHWKNMFLSNTQKTTMFICIYIYSIKNLLRRDKCNHCTYMKISERSQNEQECIILETT